MFRWDRVVAMLGVLAMAIVGMLSVAPVVGDLGRRAEAAGPDAVKPPWIKNGWKDVPVDIPGSWGTLATLPLPTTGRCFVIADFWVRGAGGQQEVDCRLVLGAGWDSVAKGGLVGGQGDRSITLTIASRAGRRGAPGSTARTASSPAPPTRT
jgi:hypothetical protein